MSCEMHNRTEEERIVTVLRHIQLHITEPLDRTELAAIANFSLSHFHRVFVTQVGESPTAYIRRLRLERAGRKLRMGASDIGEVALAAGYGSHNAFSKAFKQHFGLSPEAFRALGCQRATALLNQSQERRNKNDDQGQTGKRLD